MQLPYDFSDPNLIEDNTLAKNPMIPIPELGTLPPIDEELEKKKALVAQLGGMRSPAGMSPNGARVPSSVTSPPPTNGLGNYDTQIGKIQADLESSRNDDAIKEARRGADQAAAMEMILGGIGKFGSGIASKGAGSQVTQDTSYLGQNTAAAKAKVGDAQADQKTKLDALRERLQMVRGQKEDVMKSDQFARDQKAFETNQKLAGQQMALAGINMQKAQQELNDSRAMSSANSEIAKVFQETARNKYPEAFKDMDISALSPNQITKITEFTSKGGSIEDMVMKRDRLELLKRDSDRRGKKLEWQMDEKNKDKIGGVQKEFNKDKSVVSAVEALNKVKGAQEFINKGSPLAVGVVSRALARLSGEVGVMTDADVEAFRGSQSIISRLERAYAKNMNGQLSEGDKADLTNAMAMLTKTTQNILDGRVAHYANQFSKREQDVTPEEAATFINPLGAATQRSPATNDDPRIDSFMKKNNITDRAQAIEILKKARMI